MKMNRIVTTILATSLLISSFVVPVSADETSDKEAFVTRLYEQCLDREPEKAGFDYWMEALNNYTQSGASIAYNFVFSPEFQSKQFSNEDYIEHMYALVLGRESEAAGKAYWVDKMNNGYSRLDVFYGFVRSTEFDGLCKSYGIDTSSWKYGDNFTKRQFIDCFVQRMYVTCLIRNYDISGLCYWSDLIYSGNITGSEAAYQFFTSTEYLNSNKTDEEYVKDLYNAMMGRDYDEAGLTYWMNFLASGASRAQIFDGFANSNEFTAICNEYGVVKGVANHVTTPVVPIPQSTVTPTPVPTAVPTPAPAVTPTEFYCEKCNLYFETDYDLVGHFTTHPKPVSGYADVRHTLAQRGEYIEFTVSNVPVKWANYSTIVYADGSGEVVFSYCDEHYPHWSWLSNGIIERVYNVTYDDGSFSEVYP